MATRDELASSIAKTGIFETVLGGDMDGALGSPVTPQNAATPIAVPVSADAEGVANAVNYLYDSLVAAGVLNSVE